MTKSRNGFSEQMRKDLLKRFKPRQSSASDNPISELPLANKVSDSFCRFEDLPEYKKILIPVITAKRLGVENPFFKMHEGTAGASTVIDGKVFINFASYNYLGLAGHASVNQAAKDAIDMYGTSASASRLVSGERPVHQKLEKALAELYDVEDSIVFVSGHATNVTAIGCIFGPKDLIIHDSLIHNSVMEGVKLSGASRRSFPHNDFEALESILAEVRTRFERVLIVIEGLYSMDGDTPDLPKFIDIKTRYQAFLMVDEAHSLGVVGENGYGLRERFGIQGDAVDIWMGTLSKTLAGCGGYIAGNRFLVEYLRYASPGFVYSVGMSPPLAAASLESLRILKAEPDRVATLRARAQLFMNLAQGAGLDTGYSQGYSVVPIIVKSSLNAVKMSNSLFEKGINVQPIIYPAVQERSARLRFFLSSLHTEEQIRTTIEALNVVIGK